MKRLSLLAVLLLSGCAEPSVPMRPADTPTRYEVGDMVVYDMRLSDGTRCVLMDGTYSGGIVCDWSLGGK